MKKEKEIQENPIRWSIDSPASDQETKAFWKVLRQYYRTGEKPREDQMGKMTSALLGKLQGVDSSKMNYPFFLGSETAPLEKLLQSTHEKVSQNRQGSLLKESLSSLSKDVLDFLRADRMNDFSNSISKALEKLAMPEVEGSDASDFRKEIELFRKELPEKGSLVSFGPQVPFFLLDHLLSEFQSAKRRDFKVQLQRLVSGLNNLLTGGDDASGNDLEETFDFANEIIAFDKLTEIMPKQENSDIPETRLRRLRFVVTTLTKGLEYFGAELATIIVDEKLNKKYKVDTIFNNSTIIKTESKNTFQQAQKLFDKQIKTFTELIKAYRIAQLEVEGNYDDEVHDEYFTHFTWHRLFEEELTLFHPLLLIVDHSYVMEDLTSFSRLLASNQPIKVLAINNQHVSEPDENTSWEDASHQFRQELAAIAISHRNTYTLQAGIDDPTLLYRGLEESLKSTAPSICHLLLPEMKSDVPGQDHLSARAAAESRFFPKILYNQNKGGAWGSRFDITGNIEEEKSWPAYVLTAKTSEESEAMIDVSFTYADYKAIHPKKVHELLLIPSQYYTEDLVPLPDYLELEEAQLYGKIPYIWLVDHKKELHRAAVPNVWVVSCQERLDFWNFIQELGGVNNYYMNQAVAQKNKEFHEEITRKEEELIADHQLAIEQIREEAIGQAAERLIKVLLDDEELDFDLSANDEVMVPELKEAETQEETVAVEMDVPSTDAGVLEPWVDSDDCTSCNECVDKYAHLFKYNEDKQAYITDPKNGTYAELVKAAEKCPAYCIHPGLPLNPNEKGLDKLIKRGEKFN